MILEISELSARKEADDKLKELERQNIVLKTEEGDQELLKEWNRGYTPSLYLETEFFVL